MTKKPAKQAAPTLKARQIRSGIGFDRSQKATLRALGLERIGRVRELPDNRQVRGMISKIPHLVAIEANESNEN